MKKKQYTEIACQYGWTKKDAERAFDAITSTCPDIALDSDLNVLATLAYFAGPELKQRQALQAAQKGLVTRRNNQIEKMDQDYRKQLQELEEVAENERSVLIPIISRIYRVAKRVGFNDPWVEALLDTYDDYKAS